MNNLERTGADFSIANFRFRTIDNKPICDALENCPHGRRELFWMQMFYNHETLICKKAVYLKYGKHNLKYKTCIDNYWCIQLVMKGCSSCSTDEIMFVGRAEGSSTGADGKASPEAVKNFTILYKDFWSKYKFKESECADMLWNGTYSARFMRHVKKHVNALNLKNFDYEFFNKDIDERIQKIDIETIMNKKQYIAILSVLTKYKKKKIRNKIERCKRYLAKHKLAYNLMRDI